MLDVCPGFHESRPIKIVRLACRDWATDPLGLLLRYKLEATQPSSCLAGEARLAERRCMALYVGLIAQKGKGLVALSRLDQRRP